MNAVDLMSFLQQEHAYLVKRLNNRWYAMIKTDQGFETEAMIDNDIAEDAISALEETPITDDTIKGAFYRLPVTNDQDAEPDGDLDESEPDAPDNWQVQDADDLQVVQVPILRIASRNRPYGLLRVYADHYSKRPWLNFTASTIDAIKAFYDANKGNVRPGCSYVIGELTGVQARQTVRSASPTLSPKSVLTAVQSTVKVDLKAVMREGQTRIRTLLGSDAAAVVSDDLSKVTIKRAVKDAMTGAITFSPESLVLTVIPTMTGYIIDQITFDGSGALLAWFAAILSKIVKAEIKILIVLQDLLTAKTELEKQPVTLPEDDAYTFEA